MPAVCRQCEQCCWDIATTLSMQAKTVSKKSCYSFPRHPSHIKTTTKNSHSRLLILFCFQSPRVRRCLHKKKAVQNVQQCNAECFNCVDTHLVLHVHVFQTSESAFQMPAQLVASTSSLYNPSITAVHDISLAYKHNCLWAHMREVNQNRLFICNQVSSPVCALSFATCTH